MFLLPLSYSCQAEILSRFLDVSFPEPEISPTATASTASTTAADAPLQAELEPIEYLVPAATLRRKGTATAMSSSDNGLRKRKAIELVEALETLTSDDVSSVTCP